MLALDGGTPAVSRPIRPFNAIGSDERDAVLRVLDSARPLSGFYGSPQPGFFGGPEVLALESAWCARFGCAHAVAVNSATSGLVAAVGAAGIGPGDEVILPPVTMSATAMAVLAYGGIPVFVDLEPDHFCLDPDLVEAAITPATRAIIAVNLFGHPAELIRLRALADARGLVLIEDNAQAALGTELGRWCGTIGHIGVFSLNVHKHIQAGEAGVCVTDAADFARRVQLIRNHGENVVEWLGVDDLTNAFGFNYRPTEITAAVALAQLGRIEERVARCEHIGTRLSAALHDFPGLVPPPVRTGCRHVYFMWTAKFDAAQVGCSRAAFCNALKAEGVPVAEGYVRPLYHLPLFQQRRAMGRDGFPFTLTDRRYPPGLCPVAEDLYAHSIVQFQPVSWDVDDEQIDMIAAAFRKVHAAAGRLGGI